MMSNAQAYFLQGATWLRSHESSTPGGSIDKAHPPSTCPALAVPSGRSPAGEPSYGEAVAERRRMAGFDPPAPRESHLYWLT